MKGNLLQDMANEIHVMIVYALYYLVFLQNMVCMTKFHVDQHSAVYE